MSQLALQALRGGALTPHANKVGSAYEATHALYEGCFLHMYTQWVSRGLTISSFGFLKKEIEAAARRRPATLLRSLAQHGKRRPAGEFIDGL